MKDVYTSLQVAKKLCEACKYGVPLVKRTEPMIGESYSHRLNDGTVSCTANRWRLVSELGDEL